MIFIKYLIYALIVMDFLYMMREYKKQNQIGVIYYGLIVITMLIMAKSQKGEKHEQ